MMRLPFCAVLALSVLAGLTGGAFAQAQDQAQAQDGSAPDLRRVDPVITVLEVVGSPGVEAPDGAKQPLKKGATVPTNAVIETGPSERVAVMIARNPSTDGRRADLLLLAPLTRIAFIVDAAGAPKLNDAAVIVRVDRGVVHAATRHQAGFCSFKFKTRNHVIEMAPLRGRVSEFPDGVLSVDGDTITLAALGGTMKTSLGRRRIVVRSGTRRTIDGPKVLAASGMTPEVRRETSVQCAVPGITRPSAKREMAEAARTDPARAGGLGAAPVTADEGSTTSTGPEKPVYVEMETTKGTIVFELDGLRAPITVKNFVDYVNAGFYTDTVFHRVMSGFMIQGGGFTADLKKKPTEAPIKNEWDNGLKNMRGTIAMARTRVPDSATAQFFVNVVDNPRLSQKQPDGAAYCVFGKVIRGMDTVDKIRNIPVKPAPGTPHTHVPVETVTILGAKVVDAPQP